MSDEASGAKVGSGALLGLPRLRTGRFASRDCPECDGTMQPEGDGDWRCDGLIDPEDPRKELEACKRAIVSGVLYPHWPNASLSGEAQDHLTTSAAADGPIRSKR